MAITASAVILDGITDTQLSDKADAIGATREQHGGILDGSVAPVTDGRNTIYLDSSIAFEDYDYWASRSRKFEKRIRTDNVGLAQIGNILLRRKVASESAIADNLQNNTASTNKESNNSQDNDLTNEKSGERGVIGHAGWSHDITETEWEQAQRATRTATWGTIFYLITTDILGPYNVPWAISQMGYGPGFALYTVFGIFGYYSGLQLWKMFIGLDSTRYPMRNYGDVAFRIYGNWARVIVNFLQSFQFFLSVVLIIESSGQGLAQMAAGASGDGFLCFIVAEVIFMLLGCILGQIRTLQRLSWLANLAIWLNVVVIIMTQFITIPPTMKPHLIHFGTPPGPVVTSANWPKDTTLFDRVNGIMNCVAAYGGATLFNELMAEMRRPYDFWKGFTCAEIFIYACYLITGMVVYSAQGQFSYNPAYQGIPNAAYRFQTLGNAVTLISALIAALLYGNIGIKVFYSAVLRDVFHLPPLDQRYGKLLWVALVPIYWVLAWILAAAIPQITNLVSFIGAVCIVQFSYTFPPILLVGYNCQKDAMLPEEEFDPTTGVANRVDNGWKRWMRGYKKKFAMNTFDVLYSFAALATSCLGLYASGKAMHETFANTTITPFTCKNPAG